MKYILSLMMIMGALCFPVLANAQENISQEDFEERYSIQIVSGVNAKLSFGYEYIDNGRPDTFVFTPSINTLDPANNVTFIFPSLNEYNGGFVEGSVFVPINESFGVQIDGVYSRQSTNLNGDFNVSGVGAHLLWGRPDENLFGLYGQYVDYDDGITAYQIGAEAGLYNVNYSLELFAGVDNFDFDFGEFVSEDGRGFFAGEAIFAYYPKESLRVSVGVARNFEETKFVTGAELQLDNNTSSIFVNAQFGERTTTIRAGVSLYFGQEQNSLLSKHRDGTSGNRLLNNFASLEGCVGLLFDETTISLLTPNDPFSFNNIQHDGCNVSSGF